MLSAETQRLTSSRLSGLAPTATPRHSLLSALRAGEWPARLHSFSLAHFDDVDDNNNYYYNSPHLSCCLSRAASVKKLVVKVKPTKDLFADLSRELYDWQWPAVYRKTCDASNSNIPHNTARGKSSLVLQYVYVCGAAF